LGLAAAYVGRWYPSQFGVERDMRQFVAYQIAYAEKQRQETGTWRFRRIENFPASLGPAFPSGYVSRAYGVELVNEPGDTGFCVWLYPQNLPPFPYNTLAFEGRRSYRADQTCQIRMVHVRRNKMKCPPDAPVVWLVGTNEVKQALNELRQGQSRLDWLYSPK
jgi:hypothetical protein